MARSTAAFERVIDLQLSRLKSPEIQKVHAAVARRVLTEHLQKRQDVPEVVTFVDGRQGASEESVKPFGVIRYEFRRLAEVAAWALARCRELSPVDSGAYREAWFVMSGGKEVAGEIPEAPELIVTNDSPYHRSIITGAQRNVVKVPPGIIETVRQQLFKEFGRTLNAEVRYLDLAGAYRLKRDHGRKGRRIGDPITYPALVLRAL